MQKLVEMLKIDNKKEEKPMDDVNVNTTPTETPEVQPNIGDIEKLTCPRCGKRFDLKEKSCPYCGLKNNLKLCPTCGATIAKDAKHCPKCGAKNKKPIFKKV